MNKSWIIVILTVMFFVPFVLAAPSTGINLLDQILGPFGNINVATSYFKYAAFVDAVLYFMLFIGLAKAALGEKFKDHTIIPITLGIILAIGMCVFELKTGWNLSLLSGYAALIFFSLLIVGPYILMKQWGAGSFYAFSIAYLVTFSIINGTGLLTNSEFTKTLGEQSIIWTLMWLLYAISIIGTIAGIVKMIKGNSNGSTAMKQGSNMLSGYGNDYDKAFKKQKKAEDNFVKMDSQMKAVENQLANIDTVMTDLENKDLTLRNDQLQLIENLQKALAGTQQLQAYVRQMSARSTDPAYAQYAPQVQEAVSRLAQFINSLRQIIIKLDQDMQKSSELDVQQLEIDKNLPKYIDTLIKENNGLLNLQKDFRYVEKIDKNLHDSINAEYMVLNKEIADQLTYAETLKKDINTEVLESIKKIDADNKIILDDMLQMIDDTKLTQMRFKWYNSLFESRFINDQSLAKIQQYIPTLRRNITLIMDVKKRFRDSFNNKNDAIKNKFLKIQNDIVAKFQNIVKKSTEATFNDFSKNESEFITYRNQIKTALDKIIQSRDAGASVSELQNIVRTLTPLYQADKKNVVYLGLARYLDAINKILKNTSYREKDPTSKKPTNMMNSDGIKKLNEIIADLNSTLSRMEQLKVKENVVKNEGETIGTFKPGTIGHI